MLAKKLAKLSTVNSQQSTDSHPNQKYKTSHS
jgi:hypothetical protein